MRSLPQHAADSDTWVTEYLMPSWVILPNDQPVLAIIQPGETTLEALESVCKVNTQKYTQGYSSEAIIYTYSFSVVFIIILVFFLSYSLSASKLSFVALNFYHISTKIQL